MLRATAARLARPNVRGGGAAAPRQGKGLYAPGRPGQDIGKSEADKKLIEYLRPMPRPAARSEEERARLREMMIRYGKFRRAIHLCHVGKQRELMRAKAAAFDALPNYRRLEAIHSKIEPLPINRPLITHTPPIPGFNAADLTRS